MLSDQMISGSSPIMVTPVVSKSHRPSLFEMNFNPARFLKQPVTPLIDDSSLENLRLSHQISWCENLFTTPSQTSTIIDNSNMTPSICVNSSSIAPVTNSSITNARSLYNVLDHYYKSGKNHSDHLK
jgi:hypothetical protein